ncbi:hypothetical protein C4544_03555 [candidate division WS5 bacterium]|uniref:Uncharacterized protein n=1 Tax=candidate division WS5 bacterium TaxID=2093353 RepID=A0A419DDF2_9BACT|nr:MAG: hypothetical protein C4544_03555 [candidate division WS5 bacterium]
MPIEGQFAQTAFSGLNSFWFASKFAVMILSLLYFVFSLIVLRQINFMTEVLITDVAPVLRAFAILHSGLALGIIILLIGFLFS